MADAGSRSSSGSRRSKRASAAGASASSSSSSSSSESESAVGQAEQGREKRAKGSATAQERSSAGAGDADGGAESGARGASAADRVVKGALGVGASASAEEAYEAIAAQVAGLTQALETLKGTHGLVLQHREQVVVPFTSSLSAVLRRASGDGDDAAKA